MQPCRISGCPGHYEDKLKLYAARYKGQPIVVDHIPMQICDFCGDTLLTLDTVERLEQLREQPPASARMIPLYEYTDVETQRETEEAKAHAVAD
jgi:YgiT-type zinc finger domain-containing protein